MRKLLTAIACQAACAGLAGTAFAATLVGTSGIVLVNQGAGFVAATEGMPLATGDQVVINSNSTARIVYGEECATDLQVGEIATVVEDAPCGAAALFGAGSMGLTPTTAALAAAVVAGGVAVAAGTAGSGNEGGASP